MTSAQLKRREALLARNDAALERWPDRTGTDFSREMKAVIEGLKTLAGKVDSAGGDPLESSRNWRYVGNAYFDLANAKDLPLLILAVAAYEKSEGFLAGTDEAVERMKLDYSLGNALFHLSDAKNLDLLQRARRRYASALEIASAEMPAAVDPARKALAAADRVIALLTQAQGLSERMEELKDELERTEEEPPMDELHQLKRNTDRLRPILGHLADVERRLQSEIAVPRDELEQVSREIDELREVSEEMGSGPWSVFYEKYRTLLHDHLQAAGIRLTAPRPVGWNANKAVKELISYAQKSDRDTQTVDFVHSLYQVVGRMDSGEQVSQQEIQPFLDQMDAMGAAVLELTAEHPQLAGQFARVRKRFQTHLANRDS